MERSKINGKIKIVSVKNNKITDFYLIMPDGTKEYAFSRKFTTSTYDLCKAGIRVRDLTAIKSRNHAVMDLVKYTEHTILYLQDYYEIAA